MDIFYKSLKSKKSLKCNNYSKRHIILKTVFTTPLAIREVLGQPLNWTYLYHDLRTICYDLKIKRDTSTDTFSKISSTSVKLLLVGVIFKRGYITNGSPQWGYTSAIWLLLRSSVSKWRPFYVQVFLNALLLLSIAHLSWKPIITFGWIV